jgi:hypothetical protein
MEELLLFFEYTGVNDVGQREMHTAKLLIPEPRSFETGNDQIPAEMSK